MPYALSCVRLIVCLALLQDDTLLAYQIGFDLFENEMQSFLLTVSLLPIHCILNPFPPLLLADRIRNTFSPLSVHTCPAHMDS